MRQFPDLVKGLVVLANNSGLAGSARQLTTAHIPLPEAKRQDWKKYADFLFTSLLKQRDLGSEWNLNSKTNTKLNDYFYANELLVQCLKVAAVSDRQAVLNSLLLPPAQPASAA